MSTTIEQPSDEQPSSSILNISVDSTSSAILSPHKKKLSSSSGESIRTFCRIRPFNGTNELFHPNESDDKILQINPDALAKLNINPQAKLITSYTFTKVFDEKSTQEEVFQFTCQGIIDDLLQKQKSGLIFTYGMTNAGKTFTVTGTPSSPGILPQSLQYLFQSFTANNKTNCTLYCNFVEIYQDDAFDLLSNDPTNKNKFFKKKINVKENSRGVFFLSDVTYSKIDSIDTFTSILNKGISKKVHSATNLNQNSSRSHTIFKIILLDNDSSDLSIDDPNATHASLSIVDLAGSERANRTEATGKNLQEACKINQSLSILGKCLEAMKHNSIFTAKKIVPFRESKLTKLFCEYFQGEQNIIMITNINPRKEDFEETLRALNYSCIAKDVKPIKSRIVSRNTIRKIVKNSGVKNNNKKDKANTIDTNESITEVNDTSSENDGISSEYFIKGDDDIVVSDNFRKEYDKLCEEANESNAVALAPQENSNGSDIAKLIYEIQKLRDEVANLKSPKGSNSKSKEKKEPETAPQVPPFVPPFNGMPYPPYFYNPYRYLPSAPVDVEEIQKDPSRALEVLPPQAKNNGINFIFINSKFSDFHMGKNGPILEEDEEDSECESDDERKKKNKGKGKNKKQKKKPAKKRVSNNNINKKKDRPKQKDVYVDTEVVTHEEEKNMKTPIKQNIVEEDANVVTEEKDPEIISGTIEFNKTKSRIKPGMESNLNRNLFSKSNSSKSDFFFKTQPRKNPLLFSGLCF